MYDGSSRVARFHTLGPVIGRRVLISSRIANVSICVLLSRVAGMRDTRLATDSLKFLGTPRPSAFRNHQERRTTLSAMNTIELAAVALICGLLAFSLARHAPRAVPATTLA